ncbi:MAG: terminase small subunit [Bdellovibrionales bacterium]|nr:terminase small subunit [Bdellovibrionales bacterium]
MNEKQRCFANNYVLHFNATRAAVQAGYSSDSAASIGHENLRKPEIRDYIHQKLSESNGVLIATRERLLAELLQMAFDSTETGFVRLKAIEMLLHNSSGDQQNADARNLVSERLRDLRSKFKLRAG